ncbi:DUF742 domain-containing protein [Microtetraspora niveoalba]|uniref:DUF742 domain-containing protein n=1 Tax=Microtetraspora niveoalba TaxID=46175 RepID=UPI00082EC91A|nr:DUF742 domain-containing protein [Microtetraspora niveoalba]
MTDQEHWDEELVEDGPVVRAYALTRGRVEPTSAATLDLVAVVVATGAAVPYHADLGHQHLRLLELVRRARPLADVASEAALPLSVVRVLVGDLLDHGLILVRSPAPESSPMESILLEVINGLRAL